MKATKVADYELVKRFVDGGDMDSIEVLIDRHRNKVFTYILMTVKSREVAEDIFQDTFIKVISSLKSGRYTEKGIFASWVIRIAHNLIIDHFRRLNKMKTYYNDDNDIDVFNSRKLSDLTIEDEMIADQIVSDLRDIIDLLPDEQREVVLLRHYGNLSFKEIADQTDVSINTALGRMRYALINLRKIIEEKNLVLTNS